MSNSPPSLDSGFAALPALIIKGHIVVSRMVELMSLESILFSSSNVILRELGLKILERYLTNVSAFSSSLLAQLPF
jgi:hypothetical protein